MSPMKKESSGQEEKPNFYREYNKAQEALWKDYQRLREKLVNGYLSGKLRIRYEEFKLRQQELIEKFIEGKNKLLYKYLKEKGKDPKPTESKPEA